MGGGRKKQKDEQSQLQTSEVLPNGEVELKFRAGAKSNSGNHRVADWSTGTSLTQSLRVSAFSIPRSTTNINISFDSLSSSHNLCYSRIISIIDL
jgi:hypothetical protein